jgi:drug/metabolite transporter (DMT)-like permease
MGNLQKTFGLIFLCLVWGSTWVAIKISLEGFPPLLGAAFRFLSASIVLFIYIKWKGISLKVNKREFNIITISAFLVYVGDYGLIYWGEQYLSAGVTSIFFATFAIFTALMSNFIFKSEAFQWRKFLGLVIGLMGIMIVFYDQLEVTSFSLKITLASTAILVAALSAAISMVIIKKHLAEVDTVSLSFHQLWLGTIFLALLGFIFENPARIQMSTRVLTAILYMGIIASAVAFVLYYKLLKQMSAISLSLIIYVIPLTALVGDYLFFGEILPLRSFIGMLVIFSGIWLSGGRKKSI